MKQKISICATLIFLFAVMHIQPKEFHLNYQKGEKFKLVTRANYKIYQNGKYQGLKNKEIMAIFHITNVYEHDVSAQVDTYLVQKTIRGTTILPDAVEINATEMVHWNTAGAKNYPHCSAFLALQGLPSFPFVHMNKDVTYEGDASYYDESQGLAYPIKYTALVKGKVDFNGEDLELIEYFFHTQEENQHSKIRGNHKLRLFYDERIQRPVYMDDYFEDAYINGADTTLHKGFYLYFFSPITPLPIKQITTTIAEKFNLPTRTTDKGLIITLEQLHFEADSVQIVADDRPLLDYLASKLQEIKNRTFLVVGHTADTNNPLAEKKLATERAQLIADYLQKSGIPSKQIKFAGKGATEPLVAKTDEESMKKNRRVEIIILED